MSDNKVIFELVCRTCMKSSSRLRPLFPHSENLQFVRALYLSTGLKIKSDDGLPQNICRKCSKTIEECMRFRTQSNKTEKKLLKYFKHNQEPVDAANTLDEKIIIHKKLESLIEKEKDNLSDSEKTVDEKLIVTLGSKIKLKIKEKEDNLSHDLKSVVDVNESRNFSSHNLEDDFSASDDELLSKKDFYSDHYNERAEKLQLQTLLGKGESYDRKRYLELIEGPVIPKQPVKCKVCKKYSKCVNSFQKHAMSHLGYNILCEFCAKSCISTANLLRHQRRKHGLAKDNSFPCSACNFQAIDREQLEVHERRTHTKERPFVCDDCGAAFFSKRVLIQHQANHKSDHPFQCELCPMKFKLRCRLTKHVHRVHTKKYSHKYTYGCYICLKKYSRTEHVRKHLVKIHCVPLKQQDKVQRFLIQNNEGFTVPINVTSHD